MNGSEAVLIAWVAAQCRTIRGRERYGPVMRSGRVFAPGAEVDGGVPIPAMSGRNAYAHATATGLIFAEGCAITASGIVYPQSWCLDGDIVVDPTHARENKAFFGVAVTPQYLHRLHELNRYDDGGDGFRGMLDANNHAGFHPDPAADLLLDTGREVPAWIREWSLDGEPEPGGPHLVNPPQDIIERLCRADLFGTGHQASLECDPERPGDCCPVSAKPAPSHSLRPIRGRVSLLPAPQHLRTLRTPDWPGEDELSGNPEPCQRSLPRVPGVPFPAFT